MRPQTIAVLATVFLASFALAQARRPPRFEDLPVTRQYRGVPAHPDFSTNSGSRRFHTRTTEGARAGPNFAGEWTIITWGCGTSCQSGLMVSARTGRIVDLPRPMSRGAVYRKSSRLLILDPVDGTVQPYEMPWTSHQTPTFTARLWKVSNTART